MILLFLFEGLQFKLKILVRGFVVWVYYSCVKGLSFEHNFLVFRTAKTKVVGRKAKHVNYRQVKRFNTDETDTLILEKSPQTYTVDRNGREATKITTSGNITPYVTGSASVYDTSAGVQILDLDAPSDTGASNNPSMQRLDSKLQELNRRIQALDGR